MASLSSTSSVRNYLLNMKEFVSRFIRNDEREELKDQLETMASEYEYGWSDGDDSDESD